MTIRVTQPEREKMLRLRMEGMNNSEIAKALHRTNSSVTNSIGKKKGSLESDKWRKCLMCGKKFLSAWAGNRKCRMCNKVTQGMSSSLEP